jgi:hypothetical protein
MKYPTKAEVDQKAHDIAFEAATQHGIDNILREYGDVPRSDANIKGIKEICAEFLGVQVGEIAPDLPTFRSAVEADPTILKRRLCLMPAAQQKLEILDDIEKLLEGVMSPFDLRAELKKVSFQSLEQVHARKAQIIERQRLSKLSSTAIKQELAASRPRDERRYPGYPNLPEMIVPPGQVQAVKCNTAYLLGLAKNDFYEYKRLCTRFGSEQITARQRGEI